MRRKMTLPKGTEVPNHIAIILDGNGRWARSRGLPATKGHEAGAKALQNLMRASRDLGIHTITVWGFSTENWKRPPKEVFKIMQIIHKALVEDFEEAQKEGVRVVHLGRKDRLPPNVVNLLARTEEKTKHNTKFLLNLALDYGGRDEIIRAVQKVIKDKVPAGKVDEKLFDSYLDTADQPYPYPDLFIRTSGEQRTSGLMPWQMVYTEFYFEQDHLPDMTPEKLKAAILDYSRRRRRFGAKDKVKHLKFKPELIANLEVNWWRLSKIPEGTTFTDYTIEHLKEQWGLSKSLAKDAAKYMVLALASGEQKKWGKAGESLSKFYKLIKDEVKLAFEPSLAASLELKLLQKISNGNDLSDVEDTTRKLVSEVYRLSDFQASKAAHLKALAALERQRAVLTGKEVHWEKAEDYLEKYYKALKDRVA